MTAMTPADLDVRHAYADVNGLRMHYVEKGAGPVVLLLHGFPEMWWSWRYQIQALSAAGYRVVAPDLRGYNETDARGPYDIDTLRDDVVALLDHLGVAKALVVSHDWGGAVAWHLATTRQERCEKLVAMNCPHPILFQDVLNTRWSQVKRSWYMFLFQIPWLPERLLLTDGGRGVLRVLRQNVIDKTNFGDEELAPFVEAVRKPGRARAMIDWYRAAMRAGLRARRAGKVVGGATPALVTIPTLIVWGLEDTALGFDDVVPGTERYAPNLEIHKIANCGHFVQQERPDDVNRKVLEFLRAPAAARSA